MWLHRICSCFRNTTHGENQLLEPPESVYPPHTHTTHFTHPPPPTPHTSPIPPSSGLPVVLYWPEEMPQSPGRRRRLMPPGRGPATTPHLVGLGVEPRSCHMMVRWTPPSEYTQRQDSRNTFAKKLRTPWYIPHTSCWSHCMWCLYLCVAVQGSSGRAGSAASSHQKPV